LIAHSVAERTRELGIRLALGATVPQAMAAGIRSGVVRQGRRVPLKVLVLQTLVFGPKHGQGLARALTSAPGGIISFIGACNFLSCFLHDQAAALMPQGRQL